MIKKIVTGAVALAAVQAAPAFAASLSEDFTVTGTVNSACSTFSGSEVKFNTIAIDAATGKVDSGQTAVAATAQVWCNKGGAKISYAHDAMTTNVSGTFAGFTKTIDFTPVIKVGATDITTSPQDINIVDALLSVGASLIVPTDKPVAGTYTGKITVTLTPGV